MLRKLAPFADELYFTRSERVRSMDPLEIAKWFSEAGGEARCHVVPNPNMAIQAAYEASEKNDLLCCTGSIYLAGIARKQLLRLLG